MPTGDAGSLSSFYEKDVLIKLKERAVLLTEGHRCQDWFILRAFRIAGTLSSDFIAKYHHSALLLTQMGPLGFCLEWTRTGCSSG